MAGLKPMPRNVEGIADEPSLHNPLQRMERLGTGATMGGCTLNQGQRSARPLASPTRPCYCPANCRRRCSSRQSVERSASPSYPPPAAGWFGTIFELDGVCVEYECGDGVRSWQALAAEEGKPPPPIWALKKADGMKNEQVGHTSLVTDIVRVGVVYCAALCPQ